MRQRGKSYFSWGGISLSSIMLIILLVSHYHWDTYHNDPPQKILSDAWDSTAPSFEVWYGKNQKFGNVGISQPDFNLLGHVVHANGVRGLTYRVNNKNEVTLNYTRSRRLNRFGDINADIPISILNRKKNLVVLTVKDKMNRIIRDTVWVRRIHNQIPQSTTIHWAKMKRLQNVGQIIDGKWKVTKDGLLVEEPGYDRIFMIGDKRWKDYEITVPVKILGIDKNYPPGDHSNTFGIIMRFQGHTVGGPWHFQKTQPKWGYLPIGALGFLELKNGYAELNIYRSVKHGPPTINFGNFYLNDDFEYIIKMSCQTVSNKSAKSTATLYSFKIWKQGESEPEQWDWQYTETSKLSLDRGGVCLFANNVKVAFGDVHVKNMTKKEFITLR